MAGPVARAVANALMGVHIALIDYARQRLLSDERPTAVAAAVRAHGERAFGLLEHGLRDVARGGESAWDPVPSVSTAVRASGRPGT